MALHTHMYNTEAGFLASLFRRSRAMARHLRALAVLTACCLAAPAIAAPEYLSYYALGRYTRAAADHVNLYWVYGDWNENEAIAQLAEAKALGMPALVHTEFVFFEGPYQTAQPRFAIRPDAEARWATFVDTLHKRGLLDTMIAVYPCDEPNINDISDADLQRIIGVVKGHRETADKKVAAIFSAEIAQKWGGHHSALGREHSYGTSLRMLDWVGFDCYECSNIFSDPLWRTPTLQGFVDGPTAYANFRRQLDLPRQKIMLIAQSYLSTVRDANGNFDQPDDPEMFFDQAQKDPAVVALVPFTWFDQPGWKGTANVPTTLNHYRSIGQRIAGAHASARPGDVVEYVKSPGASLQPGEHYFYSADVAEQKLLDAPTSGFIRSGQSFAVFPSNAGGALNVCRFYASAANPGAHFFTPLPTECASLKSSTTWLYEGTPFAVRMPDYAGTCPSGLKPLYRLYKNGTGGVPNHRLTADAVVRAAMLTYGWVSEGYGADGVIACVDK